MDHNLDQTEILSSQEKTRLILEFAKAVDYEYLREENSQSAPWLSIKQLKNKLLFLCKHQIIGKSTDHMELMSETLVKYMELVVTFVHSGVELKSQRKYLSKCLDIVPEALPSDPPEFRKSFLEIATEKILEIFVMDDLSTLCKGYLINTFNCCIRGSDKKCRSKLGAKLIDFMYKLFDQLLNYGDYVIQSDILETIFRIFGNEIRNSKKPELFISGSEKLSLALQKISSLEFDRDIRKWLNKFNRKSKKTFSLCSTKLQLGDVTVQAPVESDGMWIDFNLQDSVIGWYCDVDLNDDWTYVTLSTSNVIKADLTRENNIVTLTIMHNDPYICNNACYNYFFKELEKVVQIRFENIGTEEWKRFRESVLPIMFPTQFSRGRTSKTRFPSKKLYRPLSSIPRRPSTSLSVISITSSISSNQQRQVAAGIARLRSISGTSTSAAHSDAATSHVQENISEIMSIGDDSEQGSENEKMASSVDSSRQSNQVAEGIPSLSRLSHDSKTLVAQNFVPHRTITNVVSISQGADKTEKMGVNSDQNLSDVMSTGEDAEHEMRRNDKLQDNIVTSSIPPSEDHDQSSYYSDRGTVEKPNSIILETSLEFRKSLLERQAASRQSSPVTISRLLSSEVFEIDGDSEIDQSIVKDTKLRTETNLSLEVAEIMKEFEYKKDKAVLERQRQKVAAEKVLLEKTAEKQSKSTAQKTDKNKIRSETPFVIDLSQEDDEDNFNTRLDTGFEEERNIKMPVIVRVESLEQEKQNKHSKVARDKQPEDNNKVNNNEVSKEFAKTEKSNNKTNRNKSTSLSMSKVNEISEKDNEDLLLDPVDETYDKAKSKSFLFTLEKGDEDEIVPIQPKKSIKKPSKVSDVCNEDDIPLEQLKNIGNKSKKNKIQAESTDDLNNKSDTPYAQPKKSAKKLGKNSKSEGLKYKEPDSYEFGETEQILKLIKDASLEICEAKGERKKSKPKKKQTVTRAQLKEITLSERFKPKKTRISDDSITSSKFAMCEALELEKVRKNKLKSKGNGAENNTCIAETRERTPFFKSKPAKNKEVLKKNNQTDNNDKTPEISEVNTLEKENKVNEIIETDDYTAGEAEVKNKPNDQNDQIKDSSEETLDKVGKSKDQDKSDGSEVERSDEDDIPLIQLKKSTKKQPKVLDVNTEHCIPLGKPKIVKKSNKNKSKTEPNDLSIRDDISLVQAKKSAKHTKEPDSYEFGETEQILKLIKTDAPHENDDVEYQKNNSLDDPKIFGEKGLGSKKLRKNKPKFKDNYAETKAETSKKTAFFKIKLAKSKKLLKENNRAEKNDKIPDISELNTSENKNNVSENNKTEYDATDEALVKNKLNYQNNENKDSEKCLPLNDKSNVSSAGNKKKNEMSLASVVISEDYQNTSTLFGFSLVDPPATVLETVEPQAYTERQRWTEDDNANCDIHPSLQPQKKIIKEPSDEILKSIEEGLLRQSQMVKEPPQNHLVADPEEKNISQTLASLDLAVHQQLQPEDEHLNTPDLFDILDDRRKSSTNNTPHKESLEIFDVLKASTQKAITQFEQDEKHKKDQTQVLKGFSQNLNIIPQVNLIEEFPKTDMKVSVKDSLKEKPAKEQEMVNKRHLELQETIDFVLSNKDSDEIKATGDKMDVVFERRTQDSDFVQGPTTKRHLERLETQDFDVEDQHSDVVQAEFGVTKGKRTQDSDIVQGPTTKRHLERLETRDFDKEDEERGLVEVKGDTFSKNATNRKKKIAHQLSFSDDEISDSDSHKSIKNQERRILRTKRKKKTKIAQTLSKTDFNDAEEKKSKKINNKKSLLTSKTYSSESSEFESTKQQEKYKLLENGAKSRISMTNEQLESGAGIVEVNDVDKIRMQEKPLNIDNKERKGWLFNSELVSSDSAPEERPPVLIVNVADVYHKANDSPTLKIKGPDDANKVTSVTDKRDILDDVFSDLGDQTRTTINTTRSKRLYNPEKDDRLLLERLAEKVEFGESSLSPMPVPVTSTPTHDTIQTKAKRGRKKTQEVTKTKEKFSKTKNTSVKRPRRKRKSSKPTVDFGHFEGFSSHKELSFFQVQKKESSHFLNTIAEERSRRTMDFIGRAQKSSSPNHSSSDPLANFFAQKTPENEAIPSSELEMESWSPPGFKKHKTAAPKNKSFEKSEATITKQSGGKSGNNKIKILENIVVSKKFEDRTIMEEPPRKRTKLSLEAEEEPFDVPVPVDNLNVQQESMNETMRARRHDKLCYKMFLLSSELLQYTINPQSEELSELRNRAYSCCREILKGDN